MSSIEAEAGVHEEQPLEIGEVPVGSANEKTLGWWGMWTVIITEAFLFGYLLFSYYYLAIQGDDSFIPTELPSFRLSGPNTVLLLASSVAVWFGERGIKRGSRWMAFAGLILGLILGAVFVYIQFLEWGDKPFTIAAHAYGSLYFTITGFHMAHVFAGLIMLAVAAFWTALGLFDTDRHAPVSIVAIYWHFVDVVWLTVFFTLYVTPYLG